MVLAQGGLFRKVSLQRNNLGARNGAQGERKLVDFGAAYGPQDGCLAPAMIGCGDVPFAFISQVPAGIRPELPRNHSSGG